MKRPVWRSLRWQIVLALLAIAAVTVSVSFFLAVRFTTRDFEDLSKQRSQEEARGYAALLETQYNTRGEFAGLEEYLTTAKNDERPGEKIEDIELSAEVFFSPDWWDTVIASALGLNPEEYQIERETLSPAEIATMHASSSEELVTAIMLAARSRVAEVVAEHPEDAERVLALVLRKAAVFIRSSAETVGDMMESWEGRLKIPLFYEAPIVVLDAEGGMLFDDSKGQLVVEPDALTEENGAYPVYNWSTRTVVGYVLSARQPSDFDVAEMAYLDRTRNSLLIGGLIAAAIALILGTLLARQISRPLAALRTSAARLALGESADRLPVSMGEVGAVSVAFNAMADSLDQQQEARSRMIGDLSHELNTPLSVIQLEIEALRDGMQSPDEAVERVLGELSLLRNLAVDVGLLAENDAGLLTVQQETLDLTRFLPAAVERWRIRATAAQIDLQMDVPNAHLVMTGDPIRISQALGNLIRNALQHASQGSSIRIACDRQSIEGHDGLWHTICVHDEGPGISPEDLERIFERSEPTHRTGRGLGLTIVRQIVEAHGGYVWAESQVGEGSTFCIALPIGSEPIP